MSISIGSASMNALKKEKDRLMKLIWDGEGAAHKAEDVVAARKMRDDAEKTYQDILKKEKEAMCGEFRSEVEAIEARMKEIEKAKEDKQPVVPKHIADLLVSLRAGVDYGPKPFRVVWVSPKGRFFIMTNPGHCFWSNMMEPSKYTKSDHYLMDSSKRIKNGGRDGRIHGHDQFSAVEVEGCTVEGRLSKETKQKWIDYALKEEANG